MTAAASRDTCPWSFRVAWAWASRTGASRARSSTRAPRCRVGHRARPDSRPAAAGWRPGRARAARPRRIPGAGDRRTDPGRYLLAAARPAARRTRRCRCTRRGPPELRELCVVANFVEVWLAREGHDQPVGINYLEKIQLPHLPSIYGAMLAGVDYVLMGAGIPLKIPGALDALAAPRAGHVPAAR